MAIIEETILKGKKTGATSSAAIAPGIQRHYVVGSRMMKVEAHASCKMIPPYNISDSHWWATGRVWFTFVMVSPYHIH